MNRADLKKRLWRVLGDDPALPFIWDEVKDPDILNDSIGAAVAAFSESCPLRVRSILSVTKEVHKIGDTANTVSSPDATAQNSVNTLLNEIKADYNTHRQSTTYHRNGDTVNVVTSPDPSGGDPDGGLAKSITLANEIKADFNAHGIEPTIHQVDDTENTVTKPDAVDLETVKTLANDIKSKYSYHLAEKTDGRQVYIGSIIADSKYIRLESLEYPVNQYPPIRPEFDYYGGNFLYMSSGINPGNTGELVFVFWHKKHTVDDSTSTIPIEYENVLQLGAEAYALLQHSGRCYHQAGQDLLKSKETLAGLSSFEGINTILADIGDDIKDAQGKINVINIGDDVPIRHLDLAQTRLNHAQRSLEMLGHYSPEADGYLQAAVEMGNTARYFWDEGNMRLNQFISELNRIQVERSIRQKPRPFTMNIWED